MTGQAGKVARGLRTIGANITQLAQNAKTLDITVDGATKTIQLWNEEGTDMLDTYDVLKQISEAWQDMSDIEKSSLAIDLAKKTQMDTFLAVMGNFADAEEAYTTALLSEGSAWRENEKYMESIEAHQAKLKQAWEELVLSKPFEDLEKTLLDVGTALVKFLQSDIAEAIVKITALMTVVTLLTSGLLKLAKAFEVEGAITLFIASMNGATASTGGLIGAISALTATMEINPLFVGATAVTLGIIAVVTAVKLLTTTFEEQTQQLKEASDAYEKSQEQVESLEKALQELQEELRKTNDLKVQTTDETELENLEKQTRQYQLQEASLRNQLSIAKAKRLEAEKEAQREAEQQKTSTTTTTAQTSNGLRSFTATGTTGQILQKEIAELYKVKNQITENQKQIDELSKSYEKNAVKIGQLNAKNSELMEYYVALTADGAEFAESSQNIINALGEYEVEVNGVKVNVEELIEVYGLLVDWGDKVEHSKEGIISATEDEADAMDDTNDATNEATNAWDEFLDNIEGVQGAYEVLTKAVDEYNQNGFISASTLKQLNKLSPEYLAILAEEGDAYTNINEELGKYLESEKEQAIEKVNLARYTAILELCEKTLKEQTDKTNKTVEESGTTAEEASKGYDKLSFSAIKAAVGMQAVANQGLDTDDFRAKFDEINNYFDGLEDAIKNTNLGAVESSKKSAGQSKDAWVEAFKEEQRQLKHLLETDEITEYEYYERLKDLNEKYFGEISGKHQKYIKEYQENEEEIYKGIKSVYDKVKDYLAKSIEQGYEKAINALKREEKRVLDEIKQQLEALKKERDKVLKGIKKQIDSLKREKEKVQKYWNDQIDAIKRENEVLQKQNELIEYQQALQRAKSQKVMVLQDGKFQLSENEGAVAEAERNLAEYQDQLSYEQQIQQMEDLRDAQIETLEDRIQALEDYYDYMEEYYDNQIDAMEEYQKQVERQYEQQIDALQEQLDTFKEGYQKTEDLENAKLATAVLTANQEAKIWEVRLDNLSQFIDAYNKLMGQLNIQDGVFNPNSLYNPTVASFTPSTSVVGTNSSIKSRASGDSYFANDEIALVGESPNTELVLGSKINTGGGKFLHLSKGSGVVNAESTRTLAGILNGINNTPVSNNSHSVQQSFNFGTISLPNVTNAESFVDALSTKFNNYSIQYSNTR